MNKAQLTDYYHHFRRWQQEGPRYVNKHPGTVLRCANCGAEVADNFCPHCGQRAGVGRVTWRSVSMLAIVSLIAVLVESAFHVEHEVQGLHYNIPEVDRVVQWFNDNKSWGTLLIQSLLILPTWVVFRFAPVIPVIRCRRAFSCKSF